jgi:hypothetical protein
MYYKGTVLSLYLYDLGGCPPPPKDSCTLLELIFVGIQCAMLKFSMMYGMLHVAQCFGTGTGTA